MSRRGIVEQELVGRQARKAQNAPASALYRDLIRERIRFALSAGKAAQAVDHQGVKGSELESTGSRLIRFTIDIVRKDRNGNRIGGHEHSSQLRTVVIATGRSVGSVWKTRRRKLTPLRPLSRLPTIRTDHTLL